MSIVDERLQTHGDPNANLRRVAQVWSGILDTPIAPIQVAECMAGLHIVRDAAAPVSDEQHLAHADGYLEIAKGMRAAGREAVETVKRAQAERKAP